MSNKSDIDSGNAHNKSKSKNITIDEKIELMVEWMRKYPRAKIKRFKVQNIPEEQIKEYAKSDEDYERLLKEYKKMQKYYSYASDRKTVGKLIDEQILKCKEANLCGVFGYSIYIENLAERFCLEEKRVEYLLDNYGTIENFVSLYREGRLEGDDLEFAKKTIKNIVALDKNSYDGNYDKLVETIVEYDSPDIIFYSNEAIQESFNFLTTREVQVLEIRYGLNLGEVITLSDTGRQIKLTRERIRQIEASFLKKLRHPYRVKKIIFDCQKESKLLLDEEKALIDELKEDLDKSNFVFRTVKNPEDDFSERLELIRNIMLEKCNQEEKIESSDKALEKCVEIERVADKYNLERDKAERLLKKYGTIENFVSLYRKGKLKGDDLEFAKSTIKSYIDIDESPDSDNYDEVVQDIYGQKTEITFYSSNGIQEILKSLTTREQKFIMERYWIKNQNDLPAIAKKEKLNIAGFNYILENIIEKIKNDSTFNLEKILPLNNAEIDIDLLEEKAIIDEFKEDLDKSSFIFKSVKNSKEPEESYISHKLEFIRNIVERINEKKNNTEKYDIMISELNLSLRVTNSLRRAGYNTLEELVREIKKHINNGGDIDKFFSKIKNWGEKSTSELKQKFIEYGIKLEAKKENSELELIKNKKDKLQKEVKQKKDKVEQAKKLLKQYDAALGENNEPDFKDE